MGRPDSRSEAPSPGANRTLSRSSIAFAFASTILAATLLSACNFRASTSNAESDARAEVSTLTTTTNGILAQYQADQFAAQALFSGKVLIVAGTVAGTEMENSAQPIILLASPDNRYPLRAELSAASGAKAADLNVGDQRVFTCTGITTVAQSKMLLNCSF